MRTNFIRAILVLLIAPVLFVFTGNAQTTEPGKKSQTALKQKENTIKYKVTFIELGSVRCIPCQKMQSVMKSVKEKYAGQVKVVFYDVWTPEGQPFGKQYAIQVIPTQVFLDENGKEFYRHEGYFPEDELVKVLSTKGVK